MTTVEAPARRFSTVERNVYAGYFVAQAIVGVVLWTVWASSPTIRSWFELIPDHREVVDAFFLPDMAVIVVGSLMSARAIWREAPWCAVPAAFTSGAVLYPTVYLLSWVATHRGEGGGTAALAIMVPPALLTTWIAAQLWKRH